MQTKDKTKSYHDKLLLINDILKNTRFSNDSNELKFASSLLDYQLKVAYWNKVDNHKIIHHTVQEVYVTAKTNKRPLLFQFQAQFLKCPLWIGNNIFIRQIYRRIKRWLERQYW